MQLIVKGQGDISLGRQDFVAAGGQGEVYAREGTAYKIFTDPASALPEGKIAELAALPEPLFNRPQNVLIDRAGRLVGYTTRYVRDAFVLCQLFPRVFRDRHALEHAHTLALAEQIRDGMHTAHRAGIVLVDPNEMNFLVSADFQSVTFIDTDSYQTRGYPATAIMESIRDRHMRDPLAFDEGTDWFSFACVSFQLLVGIHPYKGKHPALRGLDERMLANVSVLNREVTVPASAYDFSVIPRQWYAWFEAVLEYGLRDAPPQGACAVGTVAVAVKAVTGDHNLEVHELRTFDGRIRDVFVSGAHLAVATETGLWLDDRRVADWSDAVAVLFGARTGVPVAVRMVGDGLEALNLQSASEVPVALAAERLLAHDGRAYLKYAGDVLELGLTEVRPPVLLAQPAVQVLPHAAELFPGVVVQNLLGAVWVSLLSAPGQTRQLRLSALDRYRVVDARFESAARGGVLMVIGVRDGVYDRLVIRFDTDFAAHDVRVVEDVGPAGLNFVVTDAGVCVCLNEEEQLELCSVAMGSSSLKTVEDAFLGGDLKLYRRGADVLAARDQRLYRLRMN